jgi:hypothetical protein
MNECAADDCREQVAPGTPVPLCDEHLTIAAEWASPVEDLLPSPCLVCGSRLGVRYASGWLCARCEWRHGEIPDRDLAPPRLDVVYYIRQDDRIKIGTTTNPKQRLSQLWHQELLAFERGDRRVERARHERFAALRFPRTEWFRRSPELDHHVEVLRAGIADPWEQHARWTSELLAALT